MDELFEILTLQQTRRVPPMVDRAVWARDYRRCLVDFDGLVEEGMLASKGLALFSFADDAEEGWKGMLGHGLEAHTSTAARTSAETCVNARP